MVLELNRLVCVLFKDKLMLKRQALVMMPLQNRMVSIDKTCFAIRHGPMPELYLMLSDFRRTMQQCVISSKLIW